VVFEVEKVWFAVAAQNLRQTPRFELRLSDWAEAGASGGHARSRWGRRRVVLSRFDAVGAAGGGRLSMWVLRVKRGGREYYQWGRGGAKVRVCGLVSPACARR